MIIDLLQMSWYDRARGRRKFRVNEEEDGRLIQVPLLIIHIKLWWWFLFFDDGAYMLWWKCTKLRKWSRRRQPWASRLSRKLMTLFRWKKNIDKRQGQGKTSVLTQFFSGTWQCEAPQLRWACQQVFCVFVLIFCVLGGYFWCLYFASQMFFGHVNRRFVFLC